MTDTTSGPAIPRPAATIMLIDDRPELQVFMMKRSSQTVFGGMWVFPGGTVDPDDGERIYESHCLHRSEDEASALLEIESGGLAYYIAAMREAFEEAGILLALAGDSHEPLAIKSDATKARFHTHRQALHAGDLPLSGIIDAENLHLDAGAIHYVARWITPPMVPKRFDTRFFLARMPQVQDPIHDDKELVNSGWFGPAELIERAKAEEIAVMAPTRRMLESLLPFGDTHLAMAAAAHPREAVRVPFSDSGDPRAPDGQPEVQPGWVYLRP